MVLWWLPRYKDFFIYFFNCGWLTVVLTIIDGRMVPKMSKLFMKYYLTLVVGWRFVDVFMGYLSKQILFDFGGWLVGYKNFLFLKFYLSSATNWPSNNHCQQIFDKECLTFYHQPPKPTKISQKSLEILGTIRQP